MAAKWYTGVVWIMLIGMLGVLLVVVVALGRRWKRRQHQAIEQEKMRRREMSSSGRVDAWKAGSDRYVDHDKLPEDAPYDSRADEDEDDAPYRDPEEKRDPFGLFDDKPYQDPDDDDLDEDDDDQDGEAFDDDDDPDDKPGA